MAWHVLRVNAQSLTDPREVISIGFVAVTPEQVAQWLSTAPASEAARHERIDTVIESTHHPDDGLCST
jgi:hypothetical protein